MTYDRLAAALDQFTGMTYRSAPVEARSVECIPYLATFSIEESTENRLGYLFYVHGVPSDDPAWDSVPSSQVPSLGSLPLDGFQAPLHRLAMSFKRPFTPSDNTSIGFYPDKEPSRSDEEPFDLFDQMRFRARYLRMRLGNDMLDEAVRLLGIQTGQAHGDSSFLGLRSEAQL